MGTVAVFHWDLVYIPTIVIVVFSILLLTYEHCAVDAFCHIDGSATNFTESIRVN